MFACSSNDPSSPLTPKFTASLVLEKLRITHKTQSRRRGRACYIEARQVVKSKRGRVWRLQQLFMFAMNPFRRII